MKKILYTVLATIGLSLLLLLALSSCGGHEAYDMPDGTYDVVLWEGEKPVKIEFRDKKIVTEGYAPYIVDGDLQCTYLYADKKMEKDLVAVCFMDTYNWRVRPTSSNKRIRPGKTTKPRKAIRGSCCISILLC